MTKKEILVRLEFLQDVYNSSNEELNERFHAEIDTDESRNQFLIEKTGQMMKHLIRSLKETPKNQAVNKFTDFDFMKLGLPILNFELHNDDKNYKF